MSRGFGSGQECKLELRYVMMKPEAPITITKTMHNRKITEILFPLSKVHGVMMFEVSKCQHAHLPSDVNKFALIAPAVRNQAGRERERESASE